MSRFQYRTCKQRTEAACFRSQYRCILAFTANMDAYRWCAAIKRKRKRRDEILKSSGNVFRDIGFDDFAANAFLERAERRTGRAQGERQ